MAKKKAEEEEVVENPMQGRLFPNGVHYGIVQLPRDLLPRPSAQRIVQWVNRDGVLKCYISEGAYVREEALRHLDKLIRMSYAQSIAHGSPCLYPVRTRIHWREFTEGFVLGNADAMNEKLRINPETDEEEKPDDGVPLVI